MNRKHTWVGLASTYVLVLLASVLFSPSLALADPAKKLSINQVKVTTDEQFLTIQNASDEPADLSIYELVYFNSDNKPTKTFTFTGSIAPGSFYVMSDALLSACYAMQVDAVSLGFSTTSGSLQLWRYESAASKILESSVAWIKTRKADTPVSVVTLPTATGAFLQRQDAGSPWLAVQPSTANPCLLESFVDPAAPAVTIYNFLPSTLPPVTYVTAPNDSIGATNRNIGKMAPVVNELLPNPASPQTDADDEFVELYNPNDSVFDLSGFKMAYGSTSPRKYTFPEGTVLQPKQFKAFTSGDTSISLSNTLGQVWLLSPDEQVIGESKPYQDAKDGQAWVLNNGAWVWTGVPSPNAVNALSGSSASGTTKTAAAVLGIATNSNSPAGTVASAASNTTAQLEDAAPLHPAVLAGVGLLAVAYALYEYRHDIGNRIFQFRRYLRLRRAAR